ncbi:MAG: V-type ATP synthase subunit A [Actinomycetia bacterium]|nr:V-type ATP synthase subunit A [Actinomycetes bacterium]
MEVGSIARVSGPLVKVEGLKNAKMYDVVRVGENKLIGEVIELKGGMASVQVYEETTGLGPGDKVESTGEPLSVELGPGLLKSIYDGIQRPLDVLRNISGDFIIRGIDAPALDREKEWEFKPVVKKNDTVQAGDVIGEVQETEIIKHKIMVPPTVISGKVKEIKKGKFKVEETIAIIESKDEKYELNMISKWPVRKARPYLKKLPTEESLITGQRVVDTFFPITKGGTACVPGPFGSGKTVLQHQLAKWANAEIIIFIGCGERGNEMTDVLIEFPELVDPYSGRPLMERTVLIANTSNMPVAAREASIYTGITIAEYFRDMGYNVALQADSTSRWAEALREISGRLEEMPGEEGYPAYLGSRLASFYERAGKVACLGKDNREGTLTTIGSVSPPGGDLSEPVVQSTLRVVQVFWGLQDLLAYERHFPAINWMVSYSLYLDKMGKFWEEEVAVDFKEMRDEAMKLLQRESELKEIVRLIGMEALSQHERVVMETAKSVREDFLQQNAFNPEDSFTSLKKQYLLLRVIMKMHSSSIDALKEGVLLEEILKIKVKERITRAKFIPEKELEKFDEIEKEIDKQLKTAVKGGT